MLSKTFHNIKLNSYWRVGISLALSLLLHLIAFSEMDWHWSLPSNEPKLIEAELSLPLQQKEQVSEQVPKLQNLKPKIVKPSKSIEKPQPEIINEVEPVNEHGPITDEVLAQSKLLSDSAVVQESEQVDSESLLHSQLAPVPKRVFMEYEVTQGAGTSSLATTKVIYEKKDDSSYTLRSETQAHGLAAFFLSGNLVQISSGKITENGLKPDHYSYEFGSDTNKYQHANFDWEASQLTMRTKKGDKAVPLPPSTQDFLSFMYQYMFVPPLTQMELSMTNGKKLSHYVYTFEGEELVNTALGDLRSLHIAESKGESEEKTELWLAIDYHYLPIRIRMTEKGGKLYEQTVTRLSTE